jgi:hypothetical protein
VLLRRYVTIPVVMSLCPERSAWLIGHGAKALVIPFGVQIPRACFQSPGRRRRLSRTPAGRGTVALAGGSSGANPAPPPASRSNSPLLRPQLGRVALDGLAYLHKGEAVVPADRNRGNGGSITVYGDYQQVFPNVRNGDDFMRETGMW